MEINFFDMIEKILLDGNIIVFDKPEFGGSSKLSTKLDDGYKQPIISANFDTAKYYTYDDTCACEHSNIRKAFSYIFQSAHM